MVVHTHHLLGTTEKRTKEKQGGENTIAKKSSPTWTDRKLGKKEDNMCDSPKSFLHSNEKKIGGALIYMGPAQQFYNFIPLLDPEKSNGGALI